MAFEISFIEGNETKVKYQIGGFRQEDIDKMKPEDKVVVEALKTKMFWTNTKESFNVPLNMLVSYLKITNIDFYKSVIKLISKTIIKKKMTEVIFYDSSGSKAVDEDSESKVTYKSLIDSNRVITEYFSIQSNEFCDLIKQISVLDSTKPAKQLTSGATIPTSGISINKLKMLIDEYTDIIGTNTNNSIVIPKLFNITIPETDVFAVGPPPDSIFSSQSNPTKIPSFSLVYFKSNYLSSLNKTIVVPEFGLDKIKEAYGYVNSTLKYIEEKQAMYPKIKASLKNARNKLNKLDPNAIESPKKVDIIKGIDEIIKLKFKDKLPEIPIIESRLSGVISAMDLYLNLLKMYDIINKVKKYISNPAGQPGIKTEYEQYKKIVTDKFTENMTANSSIPETETTKRTELTNKILDEYKKAQFGFVSRILNDMFSMIVDQSFISSVDINEPKTSELAIDYKKLLSSHFLQRVYFAQLKPSSSTSCNSPAILDALNQIMDTLTFLFDDPDVNIATKSMIGGEYVPNSINDDIDTVLYAETSKLFSGKTKILKWINFAKINFNSPELLADIPDLFKDLPVDFDKFLNKPDVYIFKKEGSADRGIEKLQIFKGNSTNPINVTNNSPDIDFINLIKRLFLISYLSDELTFLNPLNSKSAVISLFDDRALVSQFNKILWKDFDKITYMLEFENKFNLGLLYQMTKVVNSIGTSTEPSQQTLVSRLNSKIEENKEYLKIWKTTPTILWEELANKLIPQYLLNVRQGFWINHSIRQLMRTVMFSTDDIWTERNKSIFDTVDSQDCGYFVGTDKSQPITLTIVKEKQKKIITEQLQDKAGIAERLIENIILLNRANYVTDEDKRKTTDGIFSNNITMEEYYLSKYNVKNSPWLKLLLSIQHLGSDTSPIVEINTNNALSTNSALTKPTQTPTPIPLVIKTNEFENWVTDEVSQDNVIPKLIETLKKEASSKVGTYNLSKCMTLLLALSTRYDKLEGVKKTFDFANILTQITNPPCIEYLQT